jgi:tetratricopeptide (TPR) repeat protein
MKRTFTNRYVFILCLIFCGIPFANASRVDSLERQLPLLKEDSVKVKLLRKIAREYTFTDPEKALKYSTQGLLLSRKLGWKKGISFSHLWMGNAYTVLGRHDKALENFFSSLKAGEEAGYLNGIGDAYLNIGCSYSTLGDTAKGLDYLKQALRTYSHKKDTEYVGIVNVQIGVIYARQKKDSLAFEYLKKVLSLPEKFKSPQLLTTFYLNIGSLYCRSNEPSLGLDYLYKGLGLAEERNDRIHMSVYNTTLAMIFYKRKDFRKAVSHSQTGLELAKETGLLSMIRDSYEVLAKANTALGNYAEALNYTSLYHSAKDSLSNETIAKRISGLETRYEKEKMEQKISLLASQNVIQGLKLEKRNYLIGGLACLIALLAVIGTLFIRQIQLKNRQKNILLEQKALRAQINPHFLFNALNSIQKFISTGDQDNAHKYISRFSSLMRLVLDNSDKTYVTIDDELSAVKLYLSIEQLRVKDQFEYEILVDPDVDTFNTYMPSMLIQPYVENAIWHGLMTKTTKGKVSIAVKKINGNIVFIIEDNGVGRENSRRADQRINREDRPSGMKLVKDRINAINALHETKIGIEVTDLKDTGNIPQGTKIEISMPLAS